MQEAGFAGYEVSTWYGLSVPAGTPLSIIKLLNNEINTLLADKRLQADMEVDGIELHGSTPQEFLAFQEADRQRWRQILQRAGLTSLSK